MRWWARRLRVAIATCTTATTRRTPISSVSAKTTTYSSQSGQPRRLISLVTVAVGRPSGPGTKSLLAMAMPALKADSTAASAMACHSTTAARGARRGHDARASNAGTGPIRSSATTEKASADTLPVSLRRCPDC